ncbi:hypothetical protein, partial [Caulobacter sp. 17J65-9]|uniref:hypothetical protein n=1 Tax=Caulobacter sp. 17J65-9 TaxID=2709382 RepID=UPI0013C562A2
AEARAALAEARDRLARDAVPPPPPKARNRPDPAFEAAYLARERLAKEGAELLDRWAPVIEARALVAEGKAAQALPLAQGVTLDEPRLRADLMNAVRAGLPAAEQAKLPAPAQLPTRHDLLARLPKSIVLAFLMESLPQAERAEDLPRYKAGAVSAWSGWDIDPRTDGVKVTFRHNGTAPAAVEEMALLRAAEAALAAGKPGMVVLDRKDLRQMLVQTYNGVPTGAATPAGFSTELEVRFVDAASGGGGDGYGGGWRVLDAAAVRAALAPAYPARTAER